MCTVSCACTVSCVCVSVCVCTVYNTIQPYTRCIRRLSTAKVALIIVTVGVWPVSYHVHISLAVV